MFFSSGMAMMIQFIFFPILSRIYSPEDYGIFGIFNFYAGTIGIACVLGYNQAFVLSKTEQEFRNLFRLSLRSTTVLSTFAIVLFIVCGKWLMHLLDHDKLGNWIYAAAPVGFLIAIDRIQIDWAIRDKAYKRQTAVGSTMTFISRLFNVGYGTFISASPAGLILTHALYYLSNILSYVSYVLKHPREVYFHRSKREEIMETAEIYKAYPSFMYWGNLIQIASNTAPAALLPFAGYSLAETGFFAYSHLLLDLPLRLMGSGISSVYLQKATELIRRSDQELRDQTWKVLKMMIVIASIFLLIISNAGSWIYTVFLGSQWTTAGDAAQILVYFFYFRMVSTPLSGIFNLLKKERELFFFHLITAILRIVAIPLGGMLQLTFLELMMLFSAINACAFIYLARRIFELVEISLWKTLTWIMIPCVLCILVFVLRMING